MSVPDDGYDAYYQARLWDCLPQMYRAFDDLDTGADGPLRELLNRIGLQAAALRRDIDGLWADQFIETCADWAIPYIGDLVATRLVAGLDPRGQRLDVANTMHWRRRKGMPATADAVARDITGWGVHLRESFLSLARTRHDLDAPVGARQVAPGTGVGLPSAEGLMRPATRTPAGGFADLRSVPGTLLCDGPFDEAFHHADLRRGRGSAGRYGAGKLVVYCWRLLSFEVTGVTPVRAPGPGRQYVFDPTGREIPLFLPAPADSAARAGTTAAWQVPGPLTGAVDRIMAAAGQPPAYQVVGAPLAAVAPETGRFRLGGAADTAVMVSYQFGFGGPIGAGAVPPSQDAPLRVVGERGVAGGTRLAEALAAAGAGDTVTITDSRTYADVAEVTCAPADAPSAQWNPPAAPLTVRARPGERPLIRLPRTEQPGTAQWVFRGGPGARLVLRGLFVSGGDIVLRGSFEHVKIVGCTFDPGTRADGGAGRDGVRPGRFGATDRRRPGRGPAGQSGLAVGKSVDGRPLLPVRLWIEPDPGQPAAGPPDVIRCLEITGSVLGPVRTRAGGLAERVEISDSTLQGYRATTGPDFSAADVFDPELLYDQLSPGRATPERPRAQANPLSALIWRRIGGDIPATDRRLLLGRQPPPPRAVQVLAQALNTLLNRDFYREDRWAGVAVSPQARRLADGAGAADRAWLNRLLLEDAYPLALAPAACAVAAADLRLNRVTVLGRVIAHRLRATDSILHGFTVAEDPEDGCFRFSAALAGSRLPHRYSAAWLDPDAALFTSTAFGRPGYGQLLDTADDAIADGEPGLTLLAGSSAGTQLGAFAAQAVPVRERALRIKYGEYLPYGVMPVIVHVT